MDAVAIAMVGPEDVEEAGALIPGSRRHAGASAINHMTAAARRMP